MPRVKDLISDIKEFYTPTYYYNFLSMCVYRGFLGNNDFSGMPDSMNRYQDYHEYDYQGSTYYRKSAGLPKVIAEYLSKNIYAEFPEIVISKTEEDKRITDILEANKFASKEKSEFETQVAVGARIIKPYIDKGVIKLDYVNDPIFFITDTKDGEPTGIVIMSVRKRSEKEAFWNKPKIVYYTRLEWHYEEDGVRKVKYELYKGENVGQLKWRCSLNKFLEVFGEIVEEDVIEYKTELPTFIYVKNPIKNNKDMTSVEGLSAFANMLDSNKAADEAYDAVSVEIDSGRIRIFVPELAMDEIIDPKVSKPVRHFNTKKRVYTIFSTGDMSDSKPETSAPVLRVNDQISALNMNIDIMSSQVGITPGTLRFDGKSIVTATQVITEKSDTARTVKMYEQTLEQAYISLLLLIKDFNNLEIKGSTAFKFEEKDIKITWNDNVVVDDETVREEDRTLVSDGYFPKWWYNVEHKGMTEAEAKKWVMEAAQEQAEIGALFSGNDDDEDIIISQFKSGEITIDQAIATLVESHGFSEEEAKAVLGNEPDEDEDEE